MNRTSAQQADSVGMPQRWVLRHFGLKALRHQRRPLRTHSKKASMWDSTSAERNENFIKLNRDWCSYFIHKEIGATPNLRNSENYIKDSDISTRSIKEHSLNQFLEKQSLNSTLNKNGEGGIRTHEGVTPTRFRVVRDQPDSATSPHALRRSPTLKADDPRTRSMVQKTSTLRFGRFEAQPFPGENLLKTRLLLIKQCPEGLRTRKKLPALTPHLNQKCSRTLRQALY